MARKTRGKGEGSIYKRSSDGRWVGSVEAGRDAEGRRLKHRVVRRTRAEVVVALDELRRQVATGGVPDRTTTVASLLDFWLENVITGQVGASSLEEYRKRVARLKPRVGGVRLGKLTVAHVQAALNDLGQHYAAKTASDTLTTLRTALRWAVGAGMLQQNPADHVRSPRAAVKVDDALTPVEAAAVLAAAESDELEALWWLALSYGLRLGELLDLHWPDVDFEAELLHIRKSKTDAGIRTLPLLPDAASHLLAHQERLRRFDPVGRVFADRRGQRLRPQFIRLRWSKLLNQAGIEHRCRRCGSDEVCSTAVRRFHASRHTAAILLRSRGVPMDVLSKVLGHSSIQVTNDVYARATADLMRAELAAVVGVRLVPGVATLD